MSNERQRVPCEVAVIWIDWYAYHVARFAGLNQTPSLAGKVVGLELVSGVGVHPGLRFREDLPEGIAIETLMPGVSWKEAGKLRLGFMLWQRLNTLRPRVVLVPGYYTLPGIAAALWARTHRRCSVLMTESTAFDHRRQPLREAFKSIVLHLLFSWAVTGGKAHVRYLEQLGFRRSRIAGFYDVVDNFAIRAGTAVVRQQKLKKTTPTSEPDSPYFLFVGRLAEEKNVETLISSWIQYRRQGGRWPLVLAGDGPSRGGLEKLVEASSFGPYVTFTGLKSLRELIPIYADAGCFVLPSKREPWGLVVNEAMAADLPVLVSRQCGCREDLVIEGENGHSFEPMDELVLTNYLHRMERLPRDERVAMGQRSGEIIAGFTPRGFGRAIASIARRYDKASKLHLLPETAQ
ncbi:MAG: glycosyltransferase [Janthinobacterium lividum]